MSILVSEAFPAKLIRASAGTGKTYQLSSRLIGLLAAGEVAERILATTFTRKAAAEIQERVFIRLAEAALSDTARAELAGAIEDKSLSTERCFEILEACVRSQHRSNICTLDSFFMQIAKSFALELGLPLDWNILEEHENSLIREEAVRAVVSTREKQLRTLLQLIANGPNSRSVYQELNEKLKNLENLFRETSRSHWTWKRPEGLLSANVRRTLIQELREAEVPKNKDGTQNKKWAEARDNHCIQAENDNWKSFLKAGIAKKLVEGEEKFLRHPIPEDISRSVGDLARHAASVLQRTLGHRSIASYHLLRYISSELLRLKLERQRFAFDDITTLLANVAGNNELHEIYYRLDTRISHLLLDEFQDTSANQWKVLAPFADEVLSKEDATFFCVGDVKQAIYGWRGGEAAIFDSLEQKYEMLRSPDTLEESYRSSPVVIDSVNAVFESIEENPALAEHQQTASRWAEGFNSHKTARLDYPGHVSLEVLECDTNTEAQTAQATERCVDICSQLLSRAPGCTVGILVRTNSAVVPCIEALRAAGIPASQEGGNPLSFSPAVALLLEPLYLADNPSDSLALYRLQNSPLSGVFSLKDDTEVSIACPTGLSIRRSLLEKGYGDVLYEWSQSLVGQATAQDLRRMMQVVELGYAYEARSSLRPSDFIRFVEQKKVEDPSASSIRVMTIHKAKGLEFDAVLLPQLTQKLCGEVVPDCLVERPDPLGPPTKITRFANSETRAFSKKLQSMFASHESAQVRDSLSLLYVALTRARYATYMFVPPAKPSKKEPTPRLATVLCNALAAGQERTAGAQLYARGTTEWYSTLDSLSSHVTDTDNKTYTKLQIAQREPRRRSLQRHSPSTLEGSASKESLSSNLTLRSKYALRRGTVLHALFECIQWIEDPLPDNQTLQNTAISAGCTQEEAEERVAEFLSYLENVSVRESLSRPADIGSSITASVFRERAFAYRDGDSIMTGSIDRLVILEKSEGIHSAALLDFKTDRISSAPGASFEERSAHYAPQLSAYRRAAATLTSVPESDIRAQLLFVESGQLFTLT